jgi:quinol monooxygenase YgiN
MFDFMSMTGNYENRKVSRFELGKLIVDTCSVTDTGHPYETAVAHPQFNDNKWIVVEQYDSREDAVKGHNKWVETMTSRDKFPHTLKDVCTSTVCEMLRAINPDGLTFGQTIDGKVVRPELPPAS